MTIKSETGFILFSGTAALALFFLSVFPSSGVISPGMLLQVVFSFLALWGMYRVGVRVASPAGGWLAGTALLASPLFLRESMMPIPDTAALACAVWSLCFFVQGKQLKASLFCVSAVLFRGQTVFLPLAYLIAEVTESRLRKPGKLLLIAMPLLAVPFSGLFHSFLNGLFFSPSVFAGDGERSLELFLQRMRRFSIHLFAGDFRWLLTTAAVAGILRDRGRDPRSLPFILALLFPGVFYPPERLLFVVFLGAGVGVYLVRERLYTTKLTWVFVVAPLLAVVTCALIPVMPVASGNSISWILPAYPFVIIGGITLLFSYYPEKTAVALSIACTVATASAGIH